MSPPSRPTSESRSAQRTGRPGTAAGRVCPLRYRYGPGAIAAAAPRETPVLYAIGGLYGNVSALDTIEAMARAETVTPTLCFNGDFNWFNVDDQAFADVNSRVLAHDAIQGNVEAELTVSTDEAGCGCAYPDDVNAGTVERSNRIHARLKATAARHEVLRSRLAGLPMVARYQVAACRVGVVHGDAESLAGWRFDVQALDDPQARPWLQSVFAGAEVDVFASTHTCLPAMRHVTLDAADAAWVVNNGATGMPNFAGELAGLCTRIGTTPSPHPVLHEVRIKGAYLALLPVPYDAMRWSGDFLRQWPPGSDAWTSYFQRIAQGPAYAVDRALPRMG